MMDLEELGCAYEGAVRQISVLDTCLTGLLRRRGLTEDATGDPVIPADLVDTDFRYLTFKIDVLAGVKRAYETFRDEKWEQLQRECARGLHEILTSPPATPPGPVHLEDTPTWTRSQQHSREVEMEVEMLIHEIPVPLAPLDDDDEDMMEVGETRRVPGFSLWSSTDTDMDGMTGFPRD